MNLISQVGSIPPHWLVGAPVVIFRLTQDRGFRQLLFQEGGGFSKVDDAMYLRPVLVHRYGKCNTSSKAVTMNTEL